MVKFSYSLSVSLDVYKALTARLEHDGQTHDDVIRELLQLDSPIEQETPDAIDSVLADTFSKVGRQFAGLPVEGGFYSRGLWLPNGTTLRARYKGRLRSAKIANDQWVNAEGNIETSPSAAATAITGNNVNGLRFWEAKLPKSADWVRLDFLVGKQ
jgi:hypothetical protein